MKKILYILLLLLSFYPMLSLAQDCSAKKVHLGECQEPFDLEYKDMGRSMSFPLMMGKTQKFVMTFPGKKDYYFALCSETGDKLNFTIRNANNPEEVIFDNTKDFDKAQYVEFSMLFTNKILFEVTLPIVYGTDVEKKPVCVGMLIYYKDN